MRSATVKLTLSYLAIIMIMSTGFSLFLFHLSSSELNRGLRRPPPAVKFFGGQFDYEQFRVDRITQGNEHLRNNLIIFNIVTLGFGGLLSYVLARRTLEPIEEAMAAQSRFTADASHELRTPLTAMQTEIEVALRNPKLTKEAAQDLLKSNLEEVGKLRALSDGLLRLARQDGEQLAPENIKLDGVAELAIGRASKSAKLNKVTIVNEVKPLSVFADKEALTETLVILLDNAIKYSAPGKSVALNAVKNTKNIVISIKDEGIGIDEADLPYIFERFYRADASRTKKQADGYGLGLAIAEQVVKLHKGSISVISEVGRGSTFSVTLPVQTD
jgi:two-component system sensor histidine kinase CiaH